MKKNLLAIVILLLVFIFNASAKQIQVNVIGLQFSPKNFTANIGDTIHFIWVNGFHTTTSTSVPANAATWDEPMNSSHTSYLYPITVAGDYAYECTFHAQMGMVGSFTVTEVAQGWNINGNNNASVSSKLGTTNAIPLRLFTNNLERVRIDTLGRVGIGINTPVNVLTVKSTSGNAPVNAWLEGLTSPVFVGFADNASSEFVLATASNTSARRSVIQGRKSRGSLSAPAAVANNDYLTSFLASGYDGTTFQNPATVDFFVDGIPSSGNVPTRISFVTGSNQANRTERLKVGSTGNFTFNNNQLFVQQSNGNIGIGKTTPDSKLDILNTSASLGVKVINFFTGNEDRVGISSNSINNPGKGYGIMAYGGAYGIYSIGQGGNASGSVYGVYGEASGLAGSRYGIYGAAAGGTFNAAGYFNGDVWASAYNVIADRKFKTDIAPIKSSVAQIMKLKPSKYIFKKEDIEKMGLPEGDQVGLIADEVKQVFPELVKQAVQPGKYSKDRTVIMFPEVKYESINYIGLIPVLVSSTQEQQKQIELQQVQLQDQQKQLDLQQEKLQEQQKQIEELRELIKQSRSEKNAKPAISKVTSRHDKLNAPGKFISNRYNITAFKSADLLVPGIAGRHNK